MIEIKHLTKEFNDKSGKVVALRDVTATIQDGDIFGIIGMSGAGKSTLLRCLCLLEQPTSGDILLDGENLVRMNGARLRAARRRMGVVFQGYNLLMQKTVFDNVAFPLRLSKNDPAAVKARVAELLEIVGLADRAGAYPSQLSGGQKQRVALARALATNPSVLLCDEPTSALDALTTQSVLALLKKINAELGVTIVIITHEMSVIEKICSHVAIIHRGKIVEHGEVEEVFFPPRTEAARRLVMPEALQNLPQENLYRLIFNGRSSFEPVIANMVLECRYPRHRRYRLWTDGVAAARMPGIAPEHPGIRQIQEHPAGGDEACLIRPLWKCSWKGWWIPCT